MHGIVWNHIVPWDMVPTSQKWNAKEKEVIKEGKTLVEDV